MHYYIRKYLENTIVVMNIIAATVLLVFIPHIHGKVFCPWKLARVYHCGSDGKTYDTLCDLQKAISETPNLSIAHKGVCEGDDISTTSEERTNGDTKHNNGLIKESDTGKTEEKEPGTENTEENGPGTRQQKTEENKSSDEEENGSSQEEDRSNSLEEVTKESTSQTPLSVTEKKKVSKKPKLKKKEKSKKGKSKMKSKSLKKPNSKKGSSNMNIKNAVNNENTITIRGKKRNKVKLSNTVNNKNIINIHYWLRMAPSLLQRSRRTMHTIFNLGF